MAEPPRPLDPRYLARIIDSSDDAIVSKDLNGTIQSWNRAAERIFGYTAEEAIGRSVRIIIPEDRQGEEDAVLASIRKGEGVTHFDTIRKRKDGSLVPISLTVSPVHDDRGVVIGASKIARDLSDRIGAERAARRLKAVVESSDDAIITKSLDSIITSWNRAAERMFGYTAEEAIGRSIRIDHPRRSSGRRGHGSHPHPRRAIGRSFRDDSAAEGRRPGDHLADRLADPRRPRARSSAHRRSPATSPSARGSWPLRRSRRTITRQLGEVGAAVASSLDQNAIVQQVTDLATSLTRAEFGAFFYNVVDAKSGESYMLYTLSGAPREAFAKFPQPRATAVFAPTFHGDGVVRLDDVTQDPRYGKNPPYHGMPEGHLPVRSYLAVPVKAASGEVLGGLFFGHSRVGVFTEQHERLATGIAAWASLALENARLYIVAREADRLKDEFLAVLSHELRTPLNAILGYARLLRGGILTAEKAERGLETLERNAQSLTQIVEDVLDVSRIVSGKIRLDVQPVELPLVIHNAVATVQPAADARGVRIQTIVDPRVGAVSGDPDRLQQVVWNLLSNAVKFTPKLGRVQVRLERVNSHVELIVSDTGVGIKPEFLPYVFERFRQGDAGTTRKTGGLGLGLSIVRHIIEMHGGTVEAMSQGENRGATFCVRLPLMIVQPEGFTEPREHPRTERPTRLTGLGNLNGVRVLAIDDDEDALSLLRVVLETAGADVTTLSSAAAALEQIETIRPDAVIVDLGMPGMDGFEFITRLRVASDPQIRDVPAAALTAFARSDDRTKALRSGFEMHLAKPVDPAELVASVATLVRRSRRPNNTSD